MCALRLGVFELFDRIGRGGMGEVWAAVHADDGRPLAVKVITDARALKERFQAAFRNEARAMASMEHPGITRIHEFGLVDARTAAASGGVLRAGTPYLAMERLGRALDVAALADWGRLRAVLLALLDALAHAHARGLVHRDLKPDNVLWTLDGRRPKLTDFGVAHAMHAGLDGGSERLRQAAALEWEPAGAADGGMVGTPNYMAPEQVQGHVWAQGPWTDLYALGCLAFKVATGEAPYESEGRPLATMMAHLSHPLPPLVPCMALPEGFEAWVGRLLAKSPEARFRKAADAAHALRALGAPVGAVDRAGRTWATESHDDSLGSIGSLGSFGTLGGESTELDMRPPTFADLSLLDTGPLPVPVRYAAALVPPVPADWRDRQIGGSEARLGGVGLGLYGLRRVPFVGRESERDLLWSMLRMCAEHRMAQAVVLRGPSGFGKTRLGEWLIERADELGAANGVRAVHGAFEGPGHGLPGLLERALRCVEVPRDALVDHIRRMLAGMGTSGGDAEGLAEIIAPGGLDTGGSTKGIRFARPEEHYATVRRFIEAHAQERPLVVLLDDVQFSRRTLDFCLHLLDARRPIPVLLVLTVRDEALAERPDTAERLDALRARDVVELPIGPLADGDRPALLRALLGLDADLLRRIEARTAGNALFAVQLVGDWVQRGVLRPGPDGFRLVPGATEALPADLGAVWAARVAQILLDRSPEDARALELAATLGIQISGEEWRAACAAAGLSADPELVDALLDAALARAVPEGPAVRWAFVHGMLREAILQRARDARRLSLHHQTCARVIARRPGVRTAERVARHLLAAERPEEAIDPLLDAIRRRLDEGDNPAAAELVDSFEGAMRALPDVDLRRGEGWLLEARLARQRGRTDEAEALAIRTAAAIKRYGWTRLTGAALLERGVVEKQKGLFAAAEGYLRAAGQAADPGDVALRAACSEELGVALVRQGERARGVAALEAARGAYAAADDPVGLGRCLFWLARVHLQAGELDEARTHNEAARAAFELTGARGAVASCRLMDGELARQTGDRAAAADHYRAALDLYESLGSANAVYARLNLGITLVEADRLEEARPSLEATLEDAIAQDMRAAAMACRAGLLPVTAAARDWPAFDARLAEIRAFHARQEINDLDTARLVDLGARRALASGERLRAAAAATLAGELWTTLGRTREAEGARAMTR
ncbi:MAG: AAA family ATPase [Myxococcales bacterium]|nr:AAA family ATPase [Myxococcales bacterium]